MTNEELVQLYQNGDKHALDTLIEGNKRIVFMLANKFYIVGTNSIDIEDLIQEGYMGLMIAAEKYDFNNEKKAQFITYAINWVYCKINRFIRYRNTNEETSLNTPIGEEGDTELLDYIEGVDYSFENVEEKIYNKQLRQELEEVMNENNNLREREILMFHYGWNTDCITLAEIGEVFNINKERVRQIESIALRKIRKSKWARLKANDIYCQKKKNSQYSIPGTVKSISFAERYLGDVM